LKRPNGTVNPDGFDFESWALSENIRAMGSIKNNTDNKKLNTFVWRPYYVVEYLRGNIKQRIARVLTGKPLIVPVKPSIGDMKVTVLDVGQGLGVVVQTATHTLLYDAGPKYTEQSDAGSRIVVPFLRGEGIKRVDGFVVSHNDIDHSGGMTSVLALMPATCLASSFTAQIETSDTQKKISCFAGQVWVWDKVQFEILQPSAESYGDATLSDNNRSCVLKVTSQAGSLLLTGDIEKDAELTLLNNKHEKLKAMCLPCRTTAVEHPQHMILLGL
jgi:beta-lactamase superfamily II metal-dependent hydrolase